MNSFLLLNVETRNINKFILNCNQKNINLISINYLSYKSINILINKKDYKKILKIRGIKSKIVGIKGLDKYIFLIKKYNIFLISFFIGIGILILLSNVIFSVDVIGENEELNKKITKELSNYGVEKYKFKKNYKKLQIIKKKIKTKYKDNIEWIEIKDNGIKYTINFVERKISRINNDNELYSIIAKKSGIIRNINVTSGTSLIEVGDYVSKGDILISSDIKLNDELKSKVQAKGKVYGEVWYKVHVIFPLDYYEKKYINKKRKTLYIKLGNKYYDFFKYKNFERKKISYYKNKLTGIELGIEDIRKVDIIQKKYNTQNALKMAKKEARNKFLLKLNDDEKIIQEKTLKFYNNGSKIILDMFFSVYEEIGEEKVIETGEEYDTKNFGERIQ